MAVAYARSLSRDASVRRPIGPDQASYRFWVSFVLFLLAFGLGTAWDRSYHTENPFEDFWSPPHLFIYTTFGLAGLTMVSLALSPERRAWFGPSIGLPLVEVQAPGALVLALAGMGTVMFAGMLDMVWHNTFGLDETAWSTPHSMIGFGILLTWFGFLSGRLALSRHTPISRPFAVAAGLVSLSLCAGVLLGPLDNNQTERVARAVGSLGVLAQEEAFQHTVRITAKYDLTYGNPAFVPLASLVVGFGLAFMYSFVKASEGVAASASGRKPFRLLRPILALLAPVLAVGRWLARGRLGFVLIALLATMFAFGSASGRVEFLDERVLLPDGVPLADDLRNVRALPFVIAAAAYVLMTALRRSERISWAVAGFAFGVVVAAWWDHPAWLVLPAAPAMALGAFWGGRMLGVLREPDWGGLRALTAMALGLPLITGALDLYMRANTP